jgi:putative transposase
MQQILTYTYRIYPNKKQKVLINNTFDSCRVVYNTLLNSRKTICKCYKKYEKNCEKLGVKIDKYQFNSLNKEPTVPNIKDRFPELKEVDSLALCAEWKHLNRSFSNFYSKRAKFPKFKNKKDKNTYTTSRVNNNIRIQGNKIRLPKLGMIKINLHRALPKGYKIKRVVVKNDKCDRYYVAIIIEFNLNVSNKINIKKSVGLDFKIGNVFVSSDNEIPDDFMPYKKSIEKMKKIEKELNKKRKFSKNWFKELKIFRKLHIKIACSRKDFLHKLSKKISDAYNFVALETIDLLEIVKKLGTGKNLYDTGYGSFILKLKYKLEQKNKIFMKISKWFPSSKKCSICGNVKKYFTLETKVYFCSKCHSSIERDLNAAINIKEEALKNYNSV